VANPETGLPSPAGYLRAATPMAVAETEGSSMYRYRDPEKRRASSTSSCGKRCAEGKCDEPYTRQPDGNERAASPAVKREARECKPGELIKRVAQVLRNTNGKRLAVRLTTTLSTASRPAANVGKPETLAALRRALEKAEVRFTVGGMKVAT
jgi:hypothetical protein